MKILVVGATGTIGSAVVKLLRDKGHEVIAASRKSSPSLDITDGASIDAFFKQTGNVDVIITATGDAAFIKLDGLTEEQMQLSVNSKLLGQVRVVQKGLSYLNAGGVMVVTGGILAYSPWPQTSMITMVNLGLEGFVKAAALDLEDDKRIMIVHPPWISETAEALGMDPCPWPKAAEAAHAYLQAIEGSGNGVAVFVEGYEPK